jgi:FAD/FMN-containing dehydrogenase
MRVASSEIEQRIIRFGGFDEFFALSQAHDVSHEYTVAWIDCLASGKQAGRGHYIAGNHAQKGFIELAPSGGLRMPIDPSFSLVNSFSLRAFNTLYYHRQCKKEVSGLVGYDPFFYPLDRLQQWNRMYGRAGFQQYQCVVPQQDSPEVIRAVMQQISKSGTGSFLAVLKQCGALASPGLLSFPLHGVSLALDFPQRDLLNERLFKKLDALIHEAGGRLYPAKDAHMSAADFKQAYPQWERIEALRDPQLLSKFWKRVTQ